jgi:poly-gamma-glutamate capsule biosynthesis protein CapA/YwtB (metallophosphatase superfamily)
MKRPGLQVVAVLAGMVGIAGCTAAFGPAGSTSGGMLSPAAAAQDRPSRATARVPVRLLAVGDLMLGTSVKQTILARGGRAPFVKFRETLRKADVTFGNLETPLSERGSPTPGKSAESLRNKTNFIFRAPLSAAEGLAWAGFDVVSLANNHAMDYGPEALRDTLECLRAASVTPVGGGLNLREAAAPVFFERNGHRFAIFAISDVLPLFSVAGENSPGVAPGRGARFEREMPQAIARAKQRADWVLVSVHWGKELYTGATPKQRRLGHKLVDWGADAVIGHHTHCLGPVERYGKGVIHYSLGNFIAYRPIPGGAPAWELTFHPDRRVGERSLRLPN